MAAAAALPVLPFTLANRIGGHDSVLLSYNGGINFYLGNGTHPDSLVAIQPGIGWDRLQVEPLRAGVRSRSQESAYWVRRALTEAAADPAAWLAAFGRKIVRLLDAWETPRNRNYQAFRRHSRLLSLPLASFGLVAPLALLGFLSSGLNRRVRSLVGIGLAAVAAENLIFFVTGRYRLEAVPMLCVLAGCGVDRLLQGKRRAVSWPALAGVGLFAAFVHGDFLGERRIDETRETMYRGITLRRLGMEESALRAYRRALQLSPADPDVHCLLGESYLARKDFPRALEHFEQAIEHAPDYVRALLGKAQALESMNRWSEAEPAYRRALEIDPWSAETYLNFGVYLAVRGHQEEARQMFQKGMTLGPLREELRENLERLEQTP